MRPDLSILRDVEFLSPRRDSDFHVTDSAHFSILYHHPFLLSSKIDSLELFCRRFGPPFLSPPCRFQQCKCALPARDCNSITFALRTREAVSSGLRDSKKTTHIYVIIDPWNTLCWLGHRILMLTVYSCSGILRVYGRFAGEIERVVIFLILQGSELHPAFRLRFHAG